MKVLWNKSDSGFVVSDRSSRIVSCKLSEDSDEPGRWNIWAVLDRGGLYFFGGFGDKPSGQAYLEALAKQLEA